MSDRARTALITGGTGGLGTAVVRTFLDRGWRVVVPWILQRELERLGEAEGLEMVQADLVEPDDVARAAVFLASSDSDYLTGDALNVSGGMLLH
jgi:NAD(P)-dependent dehydrogenase (short-subunit alcohol dehydrogenase family)